MNNDWLQVIHTSGNIDVYNMYGFLYMLKNDSGSRQLHFRNGLPSILLDPTDTTSSKTQLEVETFLGGSFVKILRDLHTVYLPVKSISAIRKVGSVISVVIFGSSEIEEVLLFDDIETEF